MERLGRTFLADVLARFDIDEPLVGANPYRYVRMDKDGAQELAHLIKETDDLLDGFDKKHPFPKRVFAAHSECDSTASIAGPEELMDKSRSGDFRFFRIDESENVSHASLVLRDPVRSAQNDEVLEVANPVFDHMMGAITEFEQA